MEEIIEITPEDEERNKILESIMQRKCPKCNATLNQMIITDGILHRCSSKMCDWLYTEKRINHLI